MDEQTYEAMLEVRVEEAKNDISEHWSFEDVELFILAMLDSEVEKALPDRLKMFTLDQAYRSAVLSFKENK